MREDTASILTGMGYVLDVDFLVTQSAPASVDLHWLSKSPQPSEADIEAGAEAALAVVKQQATRAAIRAKVVDAITDGILAKPNGDAATILADAIATLKDVQGASDVVIVAAPSKVAKKAPAKVQPKRR